MQSPGWRWFSLMTMSRSLVPAVRIVGLRQVALEIWHAAHRRFVQTQLGTSLEQGKYRPPCRSSSSSLHSTFAFLFRQRLCILDNPACERRWCQSSNSFCAAERFWLRASTILSVQMSVSVDSNRKTSAQVNAKLCEMHDVFEFILITISAKLLV
jgi:hypothetical protein